MSEQTSEAREDGVLTVQISEERRLIKNEDSEGRWEWEALRPTRPGKLGWYYERDATSDEAHLATLLAQKDAALREREAELKDVARELREADEDRDLLFDRCVKAEADLEAARGLLREAKPLVQAEELRRGHWTPPIASRIEAHLAGATDGHEGD